MRSNTPRMSAASCLVLLDAALAFGLWLVLLTAGPIHLLTPTMRWFAVPLFPIGALLSLCALGLYRRDALANPRQSVGRAALAALLGSLLGWTAARALGSLADGILLAATGCFLLASCLARAFLVLLRRHGWFRRRLLIVGAGRRAWDLVWLLNREGRMLAYDIAFVHGGDMGEPDPRLEGTAPIFDAADGFVRAASSFAADQIVVAPDNRRGLPMLDLIGCKVAGFPVEEYMGFLEAEIGRLDLKRLDLGWLLYADGFRFSPLDRCLKRALDIVSALLVLIPAAPLLVAAILAVKLEDGDPVLYRQTRVTRGGREFHILKLRSMRTDAERTGAVWAASGDARVTRVGAFLRRTRIDELPQLFNVLKGDMSLVGPRPERPEFTRTLTAALPLYAERHLVKAGLTGWAQINYPYGASLDDARSKLSYDLHYVKNYGILFDVLILIQTARVVLWPDAMTAPSAVDATLDRRRATARRRRLNLRAATAARGVKADASAALYPLGRAPHAHDLSLGHSTE